jgi:hypothetical protein
MVGSLRRLVAALAVFLWQGTSLFAQDEGGEGPQAPALQFVVAAVSLVLVMLILCMPSRKRQGEKKT